MLGSELVIQKIKKRDTKMICGGAIGGTLLLLMAAVMFLAEVMVVAAVAGALSLLLFVTAIIGAVRRSNPMNAHCIKRNPKLLEQADELFSDVIYRDKSVIYSHRIIANAKDITQMAAFEDIVNVCESTMAMNAISYQHELVLVLPTYQVRVSVYAKRREKIEDLKYRIIQMCPKLQMGYYEPLE